MSPIESSKASMINECFRVENDSIGEVRVPVDALYGIHTQRAINNFDISDLKMPEVFIKSLAQVKKIAAKVNIELGLLDRDIGVAIVEVSDQIMKGEFHNQFPIDVFQTGSGTSTNMNMNEVIATQASLISSRNVSATDHVNMGQSSNDVIPTTIALSAVKECHFNLLPHLTNLSQALDQKSIEFNDIIKTGRTHLMDAMPIRLSQEFGAWSLQIQKGIDRINSTLPRLYMIAQGGTAVGTGVNAHPRFAQLFAEYLSAETGFPFKPNASFFESLSCQDSIVELSGQLKVLAVSLMKIANDLRWMNSGPIFGLAEIELKPLQAGSSIMPGKVNPVIPEVVAMVSAQVIGNDVTITVAGQSGNFQLNVMLPLIGYNILQSISILSKACHTLEHKCICDIKINKFKLEAELGKNPVLVTALSPRIGYSKASEIAKIAKTQNRSILDIAKELTQIDIEELKKILDPNSLV